MFFVISVIDVETSNTNIDLITNHEGIAKCMIIYHFLHCELFSFCRFKEPLPEKNQCDWPTGVCTFHKDPCPPDIPHRCYQLDDACKVPTNHCCCRK